MLRIFSLAAPIVAAALLAGCSDQTIASHSQRSPLPSPPAHIAPSIVDATHGGPAGFYWLVPTVDSQPMTFPGTFDAAAVGRLAVEVCALAPDLVTCDGAPVARYTSLTMPASQQLQADTLHEQVVVAWNTASGGVTAGRTYRVRVVAEGGASGDTVLGWTNAHVVATSDELAVLDRAQGAGVVLGAPLAVHFRIEHGAMPPLAEFSIAADSVRRLAARVYDALAAHRDATAEVTDALSLVMDVLPTTSSAPPVEDWWQAGLPVATDMQAQVVARALRDSIRLTVDNFASSAAQRGAFVRASGEPLTADALSRVLAPLAHRTIYARRELLPALVLALGRVRADRAAPSVARTGSDTGTTSVRDPVWGDRTLDALQGMLLLYATEMLGRAVPTDTSIVANARAMTTGDSKKGEEAVDFIAGQIGIPKDKEEGAKASVCGSILMHSYRFAIDGAPTRLGTDDIGLPVKSDIVATLTFEFHPTYYGRIVLDKAECEVPENGPAAGKGILWRVDADLRRHGRLTHSTDATDAEGRTTATYATNPEIVPVGLRGIAKEDNGTITARAFGLIPGYPTLEFLVGAGVYNPTESGPRLFVQYFEWPAQLQLDFATAYASHMNGPARYNTAVAGSITLDRHEHEGTIYYDGYGPSRYTQWALDDFRDEGCNYAPTATGSGEFGFVFVAQTTSPFLQSMRGGPLAGVDPEPFEKMTITCGEPIETITLHMFNTMLGAVYTPLPGAGGLPGGFVRNSLGDWRTVQQGMIRATTTRTMPGLFGVGDPITERSTFTLRAVR